MPDLPIKRQDTASPKPTLLDLQRLRGRGISAYNAYRCCNRGKFQHVLLLEEFATKIQELYQKRQVEALAIPVAAPIAVCGRTLVGLVPFIEMREWGGTASTLSPMPQNQVELALVQQTLRSTAESIRRRTTADCYACIKRLMWDQDNPRAWITRRTFARY